MNRICALMETMVGGMQADESTYDSMLHTIKVHQKREGITENNRLG